MKKIKVYTKTGDDGTTSLFSGKRVAKHHIKIKAYGSIDELNSWLGWIRDQNIAPERKDEIIKIQKDLMIISSQLANDGVELGIVPVGQNEVTLLEEYIDKMTDCLPPLKNFVIPGGHTLVSSTHLARSVCRRAERIITELNDNEPIDSVLIFYINRLSDYLFTLSRKLSFDLAVKEEKWIPERKK